MTLTSPHPTHTHLPGTGQKPLNYLISLKKSSLRQIGLTFSQTRLSAFASSELH